MVPEPLFPLDFREQRSFRIHSWKERLEAQVRTRTFTKSPTLSTRAPSTARRMHSEKAWVAVGRTCEKGLFTLGLEATGGLAANRVVLQQDNDHWTAEIEIQVQEEEDDGRSGR